MKEIFGWILCVIGSLFAFQVMRLAGKQRKSDSDRRSVFESEYDHHKQLSKVPGFTLYVFLGLGCLLLGMYLIGMFGK